MRLLHFTTRKVELTEAGQLYYERCRRIETQRFVEFLQERLGVKVP